MEQQARRPGPTWQTRLELERLVVNALAEHSRFRRQDGAEPASGSVPEVLQVLPRFRDALGDGTPEDALKLLLSNGIRARDVLERDDLGHLDAELERVVLIYFGLKPKPALLDPYDIETYIRWFCGGELDLEKFNRLCRRIRLEVLRPLAAWLCVGAPERYEGLPTTAQLAKALNRVMKYGLPVTAETASTELFAFLPPTPDAETDEERLARLNQFLSRHLADFDAHDLGDYARVLFAYSSYKKTTLKVRADAVADMINSTRPADVEPVDSRSIIQTRSEGKQRGAGSIRDKITNTLAEQIHRAHALRGIDST